MYIYYIYPINLYMFANDDHIIILQHMFITEDSKLPMIALCFACFSSLH
jgi:hypothetical protein